MPRRLAVATLAALLSAAFVYSLEYRIPGFANDFDQFWQAARALGAGLDPYTVIGPGCLYENPWPFYYPLPAAIVGLPFAWMGMDAARVAFAGVCGFVLTLALSHSRRPYPYTALLSGAYLQAMQHGQIAPLMLAAMLWPAMGGVVACKPNIGLAVLAGTQRWRDIRIAILGAAVLCALFLIPNPRWPLEWLQMARSAAQTVPLISRAHWAGAVLLLALVRWREPRARVLLALATVPATPGAMEPLLLFAFPMAFRTQLALGLLTHLPPIAVSGWILWSGNDAVPPLQYLDVLAVAMLWLVYVPVMVGMFIRPRVQLPLTVRVPPRSVEADAV